MARAPFWSDDFDLDLLTVIPGVEALLGDTADVTLFTHGNPDQRTGRLNHPSCWNTSRGLAAYFGFKDPAKPGGFYTSYPVIECTFLEALRDAWCHTFVLMIEQHTVFVMPRLELHFQRLMWHTRGWGDQPLEPQVLEAHHRLVLEQLHLAKERLEFRQHIATSPAAARVLDRPSPPPEARP